MAGRPLRETRVRRRHHVRVVCVAKPGGVFTYATDETVIGRGDHLLVAGSAAKVEEFADLR